MENLPPPCARAEPSVHLACPLRPGCSGLWGGAREMGRPPTPAPGRTQASAEHSLAGPVERDKGEPTGAWRAGGWGGCCWVDLAAAGQPAEVAEVGREPMGGGARERCKQGICSRLGSLVHGKGNRSPSPQARSPLATHRPPDPRLGGEGRAQGALTRGFFLKTPSCKSQTKPLPLCQGPWARQGHDRGWDSPMRLALCVEE